MLHSWLSAATLHKHTCRVSRCYLDFFTSYVPFANVTDDRLIVFIRVESYLANLPENAPLRSLKAADAEGKQEVCKLLLLYLFSLYPETVNPKSTMCYFPLLLAAVVSGCQRLTTS